MLSDWTELSSTHVKAAAYDSEDQMLHVRYNDGSEWAYPNVPASTFELLVNGGSPGSFMHSVIKPLHGLHAVKLKGRAPRGL